MARRPSLLITTHGAPGISGASTITACLERWVVLEALPLCKKMGADADGAGGGVVRVPLLGQGGVALYRTTRTKATTPTLTLGADHLLHARCKITDSGLPLMHSTTPVLAAQALQPHLLMAAMGEIRRQLALVLGWVPPLLDLEVVRVRQGLLAFSTVTGAYKGASM